MHWHKFGLNLRSFTTMLCKYIIRVFYSFKIIVWCLLFFLLKRFKLRFLLDNFIGHFFYIYKYFSIFLRHFQLLLILLFLVSRFYVTFFVLQFVLFVLLQGGIALTSPSCNKKQTSSLTEKGPVRLSNTCCEMGVVKIKKGRGATLIIRKEMPKHVSSTMHVFRGEK